MGSRFIHSVLATNQAVSADGDQTFELPVNPLSLILIHVSPLNETSTLTNFAFMSALASAVDSIRVNHLGAAVIDLRGQDAMALALLYHRFGIWQSNARNTDNERRSLVIPICLGRTAYDRDECFPATKRGELLLTVTWDIADTGFDGLRISIETVELLGAEPKYVEKKSMLVQTFAATGINEVDLPVGNVIRAVMLFGTTGFTGAAPVPTIAEAELLLNNTQTHFTHTDWEVMRAMHGVRGVSYPGSGEHFHQVNAAGAGSEDSTQPEVTLALDELYGMLHLNPRGDDEFSLDTAGASRCHLRITADTANACRVFPIERVPADFYRSRSG